MFEVLNHEGAWTLVKAVDKGHTYLGHVMHFEFPSEFGIRNGRISKLSISKHCTGDCTGKISIVCNYDRNCWDVKPWFKHDKFLMSFYKAIVKEYN